MEEKFISGAEGLSIIQQMIDTAKKEQKDDGRGWILWGWLIFLTSLLTILNMKLGWFNVFAFWNIFGVVSIVLLIGSAFWKRFVKKEERVKTYTGVLFDKLNAGFGISLFFIIFMMNVLAAKVPDSSVEKVINCGFALLINLYAFWMLIYGTALNFKPSVIGAYCTWIIGFASLFVAHFTDVMWLHALAALIGYIVPGTMANREFRRKRKEDKRKISV